jgi:hypothetical protein
MRTAWSGWVLGVAFSVSGGCDRPHLITGMGMGMGMAGAGGGGAGGWSLPGIGGSGGTPGGAPISGAGPDARADPAVAEAGTRPPDGPTGAGPDVPGAEASGPGRADSGPGPSPGPEAGSGGMVLVKDCAQIICPELTQLTEECSGNDSECTSNEVSSTLSNYCHDNGVKKQSIRMYSGPTEYTTTMRVKKQNGSDCYTVVMSSSDDDELESWIFQTPTGREVARGEWNKEEDILTLICRGVRYVLQDIACAGSDGEPAPDQCSEGDCEIP